MPEMTLEDEEAFIGTCLTPLEREAIEFAMSSENPWTPNPISAERQAELHSAKVKIKNYHLDRTTNKCCYCRRSLLDANIETDREHIIPKKWRECLTYHIFNLSVACKRCNMTYKGQKKDHIVDPDTIEQDFRNEDRYLIPHPNIHNYSEHLVRRSLQNGDEEITTYEQKSPRGIFLYEFVKLERLCVNEFDSAQGGTAVDELFAEQLELPIEGC